MKVWKVWSEERRQGDLMPGAWGSLPVRIKVIRMGA